MTTHCPEPLGFVFDAEVTKWDYLKKILGVNLIVKHRGSPESLHSDFYLYEKFCDSELPVRRFKRPLRASDSTPIVITHH